MRFGKFLLDVFNVFSRAKSIRADEERRAKSVGFAVSAIVYSLLMIACAFGGTFLFTLSDTGILYIFILVIAIVLLFGTLIEFIGALLRIIAQFTINRKAMSWIALAVFIISIAVSVYLIIRFVG